MATIRLIKLKTEDKKFLIDSINRLVGVIKVVQSDISTNKVSDKTVSQVSAAKGALSRLGKEILGRGMRANFSKYNQEELEESLKLMFKMD